MRPLIHRLLASGVILALTNLLPSAISTAAASGRSRCIAAAHAKGAKIERHSTLAVIWKHGRAGGFDRLYSCVYRLGRVRRLPPQEGTYKLAGTWLAYVYAGSAIGDESEKIGEMSLITYRNRIIAHLSPHSEGMASEIDDGGLIPRYAVAANGNLVWLTTDSHFDPAPLQLRAADGSPPKERIADAGAISARSLRLSQNGRLVSYTKDGVSRTAPLQGSR